MSIPMKNKNGDILFVSMAINCSDNVYSLSDDGFVIKGSISCTAKRLKPQCERCSLCNNFKQQTPDKDAKPPAF